MCNWYVFKVVTGNEEKIKKIFDIEVDKNIGVCFIPMVEYQFKRAALVSIKSKPMFPGYVLVESDNIDNICKSIDGKVNNLYVLKNGDGKIQPLEQHEVNFLMQFADEDYLISLSEGIKENGKVIITKGPLLGREGLIRKIDRHKRFAIVEIRFMAELRQIKVGLEVVKLE